MQKRRVVITGLGLVTAIGQNLSEFWNNLITGQSGIDHIDCFDASAFPTRIAAQIRGFKAEDYIPRKDARRMDRFVQFACAAARMAADDAGLKVSPEKSDRIGVWIGSGIGGIATMESQHRVLLEKGVGALSPFLVPMMIPNMAAGQAAIMLGCHGPCACTVTACASGTNSIGEGLQLIQHGKADVMVCGGAEASITPVAVGGFCAMKAMSTRNDEPKMACRPFDIDRNGFVMGEGAGIVVLEEMEHAQNRGAKIYAELIGYGTSADAYHMVQPDVEGNGAVIAFNMALEDAGIVPQEVDYINAHGTGTPLNDKMETGVIHKVFGDHSSKLLVSSIKPLTGHTLGAAGAIELIASILAMTNDVVPPTINLEHQDPECDLDYVPGLPRPKELNVVMSDSLGFGGHNAVLIARKIL
ncbi:MAG: beta-ketoacyl-ACP synthase II [Deltaproteobacteria bacterium]